MVTFAYRKPRAYLAGVRRLLLHERCVFWLLCALEFAAATVGAAQNANVDTLRVRTRVVSVDTLILDKKTGVPVNDLTRDNFQVWADGKRKSLAYFQHGTIGQRRPLALMLVVDLVAGGAENALRRSQILDALSNACKKLATDDEVAVVATLGGSKAPLKMLMGFTRDRDKISQALASVPQLPVAEPRWYAEEMQSILSAVESAATQRPDARIVVVPLTIDFGQLSYSQRDEIAARLIRAGVLFSPLIRSPGRGSVQMSGVPGKYPTPPRSVFTAIGRLTRKDMYAPARLAEETGGEATRVAKPEEYGSALERLIERLSNRYDLGFTLAEQERDDGRMHKLQVRVIAHDTKGKERKFIIKARRGYYLPSTGQNGKQ